MIELLQHIRHARRQLSGSSRRRTLVTVLSLITVLPASAIASGSCPLTLVSGKGDRDAIVISFMNAGKLPIRRLEFNCVLIHGQAGRRHANTGICREANALFFPATPYEVRYPYPGGVPKPVLVSVKSVALSNGYVWKPSRRQTCRKIRILPKK